MFDSSIAAVTSCSHHSGVAAWLNNSRLRDPHPPPAHSSRIMTLRRFLAFAFFATPVLGCAYNYSSSALSDVRLGMTKQAFVRQYTQQAMQAPIPRASKIVGADTIDVMALPVSGSDHKAVDYWFLFKNSELVQWGRPEDWKSVSATYQIEFNPSPSTQTP